MSIFSNWWNYTLEWFSDRQDRNRLVRTFNKSARDAFVTGVSPVLMEASVSRGDDNYKHSFSKWRASGYRIKVLSGRQLSRSEIKSVGETILSDEVLVRRLVVLGWDTLEVHCDEGSYGCKWQLQEYMQLGM